MGKREYINIIIQYLKGLSGTNYQLAVGVILRDYYKAIGKTYEMPSSFGGDDKNDGWVIEDALFYQIYSPIHFSSSFALDIKQKYETDLDGLLDIVYNSRKWNGFVNRFVFLVNTRDTNLPKDPDRFYDNTLQKLVSRYSVGNTITYEICDNDYLFDKLFSLEPIKVEQIATKLNLQGLVNYNKTSSSDVIEFIDLVSNSLGESGLCGLGTDYTRVSSDYKIEINGLGDKKDRILNIIPKLSIVDDAISHFAQTIEKSQIFETVKNRYILLYDELAKEYTGTELYEKMLSSILDFAPTLLAYSIPAEMVLVYIFDRCDIFVKEKME